MCYYRIPTRGCFRDCNKKTSDLKNRSSKCFITFLGKFQNSCFQNISRQILVIDSLGLFNPFVPNAPFLYPLKTSENLTVEKGCIENKWVKSSQKLDYYSLFIRLWLVERRKSKIAAIFSNLFNTSNAIDIQMFKVKKSNNRANYYFFSIWFSFTNIHDSHDSRRKGGYFLNSSLPLPLASQALGH